MNGLMSLVLMQLKDKIDFTVTKDKKQLLRLLLLSFVKIAVITFVIYLILSICVTFVFTHDETPQVLIIVLAVCLILSLISCTGQLMKNLYYSEDNKMLITLPIPSNKIFVSKIIVFYLYEIKKSFSFLIPITLAGVILLISKGLCTFLTVIWMFIPMMFILMLPVLCGALLSIPVMYIYRFLKKHTVVNAILFIALLSFGIIVIVKLIALIPENIDLINQWPSIKEVIREFLMNAEKKLFLFSHLFYVIIGSKNRYLKYSYNWLTLVEFLAIIGVCALLILLVYLISRPIFFNMMAKNFEIKKSNHRNKPNRLHNKYSTFIYKEFAINLRTINISINYLLVYISVPILIMFLNAMYKAMDTRTLGDLLIYTFNILLICLPFLASNGLVATYYSREGRSGYLKKTKPIYALYPLFTKLIFNALFSIPAVFITVFIFGKYVDFNVYQVVTLGFAILVLHLGHMLYSAMLDIMNPQNEQYATTGETFDNPNENKSTIIAFILSFLYALIAYKLLSEDSVSGDMNDLLTGMLKLLFISIFYFSGTLLLFIKRVKAFYYEIQG